LHGLTSSRAYTHGCRAECWALRKLEAGFSFGTAGQGKFLLTDLVPYFMLPPQAQVCYKDACREIFKCVYANGHAVVHTVSGRKEQEDLGFISRLLAAEASINAGLDSRGEASAPATHAAHSYRAPAVSPPDRLQPIAGAGTPLRVDLSVGYVRLLDPRFVVVSCVVLSLAMQALSALDGQLATKRLQMLTSRAMLSSKAARRVSVICLGGFHSSYSRRDRAMADVPDSGACSVEAVQQSWLFAVLNGARCEQFAVQFRARAPKLNALKALGFWRMRLRAHRRFCHATAVQRFFRATPCTSQFRYLIHQHQQAVTKVQHRMRSYAAVTTARKDAIARLWMKPATAATTGSAAPFIKEFTSAMMEGGQSAVPRMKEAVKAFLFSRRLTHKTSPSMDEYREATSMLKYQQQVMMDHSVALQSAKIRGQGRKQSNHAIFNALDGAFNNQPQFPQPVLPVMHILSGPQYERPMLHRKSSMRSRLRAATAAAVFLS